MGKIRAVIFDIGGVLVRTEDVRPRERLGARFALDRAGIDALVFGSPVAQAVERGQADEQAVWNSVRESLNLTTVELQDFKEQFWAGDRLDEDLLDWLIDLRPRFKTGLLTNSWLRDPLSLFIERYHQPEQRVRNAFDAVITSAVVGVQKPDPLIFQVALSALDVQAGEALFVDDFEKNVAAARALGWQAILFRGVDDLFNQLQDMPEF